MVNGIEVGKEIRTRNSSACISYLTTSKEFAVDAFSLGALHYVIKPINKSYFNEAMDRAISYFLKHKNKELN